jgi:4-amino-4-deoxy-L-arabinose transferase-like glycosyltransferase
VVTGPATFIVYGAWLRAMGDGLAAARVLSAVLAAVSAILFAAIGRRAGASRPLLLAAGLVVLPHFLLTGLAFLSESLTLCAVLLGTWLWLRGVDRPSHALT